MQKRNLRTRETGTPPIPICGHTNSSHPEQKLPRHLIVIRLHMKIQHLAVGRALFSIANAEDFFMSERSAQKIRSKITS